MSEQTLDLEVYKKQGANVLLPTVKMEALSEWHQAVVEQVYLNPNPEEGDVYKQTQASGGQKAKFAITAQGLKKLMAVAGVMWHPTECRRIDNRADRDYVAYRAVAGVRKADGTPIFFKAEYDVDMQIVEDEIEEQWRVKADKYSKDDKAEWWHRMSAQKREEYVASKIRSEILQKRKHKTKMAETGAMNRVVRALLNLKNTYTAEELAKPFVIVRMILKPDYNDKDIRKAMIEASIKSITGIYGNIPPTQGEMDQCMATPSEENTINVTPNNGENGDVEPETDDPPDDSPEPGPQEQAPEEHPQETDFQNADKDVQIKTLSVLMTKKGYDRKNLKRPMVEWEDKQRLDFFAKLNAMSDKDDSPF